MRNQLIVKPSQVSFVFVICLLAMTQSVRSHSGATGIVKERMDGMEAMSDKSKIVVDMYKGKRDFQPEAVAEAADSFVLHGESMLQLFPEDKHDEYKGPTRALPEIWTDWDKFVEMTEDFISRSKQLQTMTQGTPDDNEMKDTFMKTIKLCSSCHKRFRRPKR